MAELKTQPHDGSVESYLNTIEPENKRRDSFAIMNLMKEVTGEQPVMWGPSIVGYGTYTYKYESGRTGEWMLVGFAPRKQNLTLYIMSGFDSYDELLGKLGKHSTGKSCLYIKKLEDVDENVLRKLVHQSVEHMRRTNP